MPLASRERRPCKASVCASHEKKELEKLDYMHNNPVTRGLVSSPGDWPWSSWRFYFLEDTWLMAMDRAE
jgi:hypothetical protein